MISVDAMRAALRSVPAEPGGTAASCPSTEALYDAATGALPAAEVATLIDHVSGCPACAVDWRLIVEVRGEAPAVTTGPEQGPTRSLVHFIAPAFAVIAFAAAAMVVFKPAYEPVFRDGAPQEAPLTEQTLARDAFTLRWPAGSGTYAVLVSDEAGRPIHRAVGLHAAELTVPPSALADLPAGARLLWQVEETLPDGSVKRSAVHRNILR